MTYRILMVCTGNICRSAMAEIILNEQIRQHNLDASVTSAGISDEEHGRPIDTRAARTLRAAGYPVPHHQAHRVKDEELRAADLVLAMTSHHYRVLQTRAANAAIHISDQRETGDRHSIDLRMFRSYENNQTPNHRRDLDVPDPWYGGPEDFEQTLKTIENCAPAIIKHARTHT